MKVAIVTGVVVPHDAISAAVYDQARLIDELPGITSIVVFAQHVGRGVPCASHVLQNAWQLVTHPAFAECDVAIFHWGIHYDLFDAITALALSGIRPIPVVHFHNCTPRELVSEEQKDTIDSSMRQISHVVSLGVPMWTYSEFNRLTLLSLGTTEADLAFVPISIRMPEGFRRRRLAGTVELLTVGRRVRAKGIHVILAAIATLGSELRRSLRLTIAGSVLFSEAEYLNELHSLIESHNLSELVTFVDEPSDEELWQLYARTDVVISASFHEGLCVPVIEGYAFGCRAIGTTAGNLPFVIQAPDPCVAPGDIAELARALTGMIPEVQRQTTRERRHASIVDRYSPRSARSHLQIELYRQAARSA